MAVTYLRFDGERVSDLWYPLLRDARAAGVDFVVNDGQRTFSEQGYLRRLYESNPRVYPLAARPSHTAPHIRTGRRDHALDIGRSPAAVQRLIAWAQARGVTLRLTVSGEWWHIEWAAGTYRHRLVRWGETLQEGDRGSGVTKLRTLLYHKGFWPYRDPKWRSGTLFKFGPSTRRAVIEFQKDRGLARDGIVGPKTRAALERRNP
jgi:hypothetical protein